MEKKRDRKVNIQIDVKDCPNGHIDNIILGLVHSGYEVYFSWDKTKVVFSGWSDELIEEVE